MPGADAYIKVRAVLLVALLAALASGCTFSGLALEQDKRLEIIAPPLRATIDMPYTFRWTMRDFAQGSFVLFFDGSPVRPNTHLRELAADDLPCRRIAGCPDDAWFNARYVFRTTQTSLRVDGLLDTRPLKRPQAPDRHELTIVLVDDDGVRIGESAWTVDFFVDRVQPR